MGMMKSGRIGKKTAVLTAVLFAGLLSSGKASSQVPTTPFGTGAGPCAAVGLAGTFLSGAYIGPIISSLGTLASTLMSDAVNPYTTAFSNVSTFANDRINGITGGFDNLWKNIGLDLQKFSSQLSVLEVQGQSISGLIKTASDSGGTIKYYQQDEFDTQRQMRPGNSLMITASIIGGLKRAHTLQEAYNSASTEANLSRTSISKAENSTDTDNSKGGIVDIGTRWNEYSTRYCKADYNNGNSGCSSDQVYSGEDIDVSRTIFGKETIDVSDTNTLKTVNDLVANIAEPFISKPLPDNVAESPKGRTTIINGEKYKAHRQLVFDAVNHVVSRRVPGSQMGTYIADLRTKAGINTDNIGSNPSYNEVMHVMTNERYRTGSYIVDQVDEPENSQRERVIQNAFFLMQMEDALDVVEKQSVLLSAQLSIKVGASSLRDSPSISSSEAK